ncbi:MAG: sigma-70 family RNA polymerase sigma factor [Planctomycetaceae bacterium]|nr:sigma-70 family RNA polymerase sigma factor [Planctomycetaceae bacterium]
MSEPSEELLKRVRASEPGAVAEFAEVRRPQLIVYVSRQLGYALRSKVEPEDIVQETVIRAVRNPHLFSSADRDPFGVLCHLAQECIVDAHRRYVAAQKRDAGKEVALDGRSSGDDVGGGLRNLLIASITTPSKAFSRNEKELRMWDALGSLPEEQREALRLRYVDGLPTKDIAQRLRKTDGAVRVMLTRSLDKLQQLLGTDS